MVAASHCSCFSYRVGRGQGSAAGAAEDHMKCLDLLIYAEALDHEKNDVF